MFGRKYYENKCFETIPSKLRLRGANRRVTVIRLVVWTVRRHLINVRASPVTVVRSGPMGRHSGVLTSSPEESVVLRNPNGTARTVGSVADLRLKIYARHFEAVLLSTYG